VDLISIEHSDEYPLPQWVVGLISTHHVANFDATDCLCKIIVHQRKKKKKI